MFDGDAGGSVRYAWRVRNSGSGSGSDWIPPFAKNPKNRNPEAFFTLNIRLLYANVRI
jgi:hypothetical protein